MVTALIIVDPQYDFCEGGSLAVPNSNDIFGYINGFREKYHFDFVFITQDWHSQNHISFAKNHNLPPFTLKKINGKEEMLWPVHCVQNTQGANISSLLKLHNNQIYIKKGTVDCEEQYSGFGTQQYPTKLQELLRKLKVEEVFVVGLALDYCVGNTALDAKKAGFGVTVVKECTRGVSPVTSDEMIQKFQQNGVMYRSLREIYRKSKLQRFRQEFRSSQIKSQPVIQQKILQMI